MSTGLLLCGLFYLSTAIQTSLVHSLPRPFSFFPIHVIVGLLIAHRTGPQNGVIWFLLTLPFVWSGLQPGTTWSYLWLAGSSYFLISRLFTTRSVYALIGLGLTVIVPYLAINLLFDRLTFSWLEFGYFLIFVILGLYLGFIIATYLQRLWSRWVYVKGPL